MMPFRSIRLLLPLLAVLLVPAGESLAALRTTMHIDNSYVPANRQEVVRYLAVDLEDEGGPVEVPRRRVAPLNVLLVLDTSGSMADEGKMEAARRAALGILDGLGAQDSFGVVTFDDEAGVALSPGPPGGRAAEVIRRLRPGGRTNLSEGLRTAFREARRFRRDEGITRLFLLTDGLANRGNTDPGYLTDLVASGASEGVSLSAFGVGYEYNEDLLAELADAGRGAYAYIADGREIPDVLEREFRSVRDSIYLDVTIVINLAPWCRVERVYGYPHRVEGSRVIIVLGDLPRRSLPRILVKVSVGASHQGRVEAGDVSLNWRSAGERARVERRGGTFTMEGVRDARNAERPRDPQMAKRVAVAEANDSLARAARQVDKRNYTQAREALQDARRALAASPVKDADIAEQQSQVEKYEAVVREAPALSGEEMSRRQKETKFKVYQKSRQR